MAKSREHTSAERKDRVPPAVRRARRSRARRDRVVSARPAPDRLCSPSSRSRLVVRRRAWSGCAPRDCSRSWARCRANRRSRHWCVLTRSAARLQIPAPSRAATVRQRRLGRALAGAGRPHDPRVDGCRAGRRSPERRRRVGPRQRSGWPGYGTTQGPAAPTTIPRPDRSCPSRQRRLRVPTGRRRSSRPTGRSDRGHERGPAPPSR